MRFSDLVSCFGLVHHIVLNQINMPRRFNDQVSDEEPIRKKSSSGISSSIDLKEGEIVTDISGKNWKLGKPVGIGGFGEIYEASEDIHKDVKTENIFHVAKVEKHTNGPLFVEVNCYLRIAKLEIVEQWKKERKLQFLGMPHYIASGSHIYGDEKFRFLILPRYERDLQEVLKEKKVFNLKTVLTISNQILDVLEYIHAKGYVHSDIKASNIMLGKQQVQEDFVSVKHRPVRNLRVTRVQKKTRKPCRNLRPVGSVKYIDDLPYLDEMLRMYNKQCVRNSEQLERVFLLDYGLASKYVLSSGEHREFCHDERRAHAGTVLFCSRDAHKGIPSRRSDLESLAYNMVYWLTGSLPWMDDIGQPDVVEKKKIRCFKSLKSFLDVCFNGDYPDCLLEYFNYLNELQFEDSPDYEYIRNLFLEAVKSHGYKDDSRLDFDNEEMDGLRNKKVKRRALVCENRKLLANNSFLMSKPLMPLHSNIIFKRPKLRKKVKDKKITADSAMNWSKILMDPETIMKQATRERKTTEGSDPGTMSLSAMDLDSMNPTYAMWEVYNKCKERETSPRHKGDSVIEEDNIEGYTPAMMYVYRKMKERLEFEYEQALINTNNKVGKGLRTTKKRSRRAARSECSFVQRVSLRSKSHAIVPQKKEVVHPPKKVKSIPMTRTYSLRG